MNLGLTKHNTQSSEVNDSCNGYECVSEQSVHVIRNENIEKNTNVKPPITPLCRHNFNIIKNVKKLRHTTSTYMLVSYIKWYDL